MCTLLFAWQVDADRPLIVAANRDEFYARPSAHAQRWADAPQVIAGRDLQGGGTWLGVTRSGRFAALTNVREPAEPVPRGAPSRGRLVADFLRGDQSPGDFVTRVAGDRYAGFNLIVADRRSLWYLSNRSGAPRALDPGVYGLANAGLDSPWPKVRRGRSGLAALVATGAATPARLLGLLADTRPGPAEELPNTGVGLAMERLLSPLFISSPGYGTCCSTVLTILRDGAVEFCERTTNPRSPGAPSEVAVSLSPMQY